jgi:hypothetical protein
VTLLSGRSLARYLLAMTPSAGSDRRTGDRAKAREHLTAAARMFRELCMTFWLDKADAALGGVER